LLADSDYWTIANLTQLPDAPELLIPPARHGRQGKPRKDGKPSASRSDGLRAAMQAKLASDDGKACYALRQQTIEPVFGQIKEQQGARRFLRRGACRLRGRVEAAVRHPQPAQAVAAPDQTTIGQPGDHLSRDPGRDAATAAGAVHRAAAATATLPRPGRPLTTCPHGLGQQPHSREGMSIQIADLLDGPGASDLAVRLDHVLVGVSVGGDGIGMCHSDCCLTHLATAGTSTGPLVSTSSTGPPR
jgi:Transposase DDE domain